MNEKFTESMKMLPWTLSWTCLSREETTS